MSYQRDFLQHNNLPFKLKHLAHDALPMEFFCPHFNANGMKIFRDVCAHLETLHLIFGAQYTPERHFFLQNLADCLTESRNLRELRLGLDPLYKLHDLNRDDDGVEFRAAADDFWSEPDRIYATKHYIPLHLMFPEMKMWENLTSMRLEGFLLCEHGLKHVTSNLKSLRKLYFGEIGLMHGTWKSLLHELRTFRFKDFAIWGETMSVHGEAEHWVLPPSAHIWDDMAKKDNLGIKHYVEAYRREMSKDMPFQGLQVDARKRVEAFVLNDGDSFWPQDLLNVISLPFSSDRSPADDYALMHRNCTQVHSSCEPNFDRIKEQGWTLNIRSITREYLISERGHISRFCYRRNDIEDFPLIVDGIDVFGVDREMSHESSSISHATARKIRSLVCMMKIMYETLQENDGKCNEQGVIATRTSHDETVRQFKAIYDAHPDRFPDLQRGFIHPNCPVCDAES